MLRTILKEVKEFKRASIATPIYMILSIDGNDHSVSDGINH